MQALTVQPFKAIWTLFAVAFAAIRIPFWLLYFLPTFLRQHPRWSYGQAIRVRILKVFLFNMSIVQVKTKLSLEPGKEGDQFVVMEKADNRYYTGVTKKDTMIRPERIGGTWYPHTPKNASDAGIVVLHFHGGAYAIGDGRKTDTGFLADTMLKNTGATTVFCPQYRLASNSGGRFPSQLQDAITSYCYLVLNTGIEPSKIVISGDSAGGNLALALLRYLSNHGSELSLSHAGCAWLWSPWVKPKDSYYDPGAMGKSPLHLTDYLTAGFGAWGARGLAPSPNSGLKIDDAYINTIDNAFATKTPIYISTGECEVLFHEDVTLYQQMEKVDGNEVELQIEENAVHDIILTGKMNGFEAEAAKAAKRAGLFLDKHIRI